MTEKQKQILDTFDKVIPQLSELGKEKLLAFGAGLSFAVQLKEQPAAQAS